MKAGIYICLVVLGYLHTTSTTTFLLIRKRAVSTSLGDILGNKATGTRRKKPIKVTPPLKLKPGETAERPPGWQHCIKNVKAGLNWRTIKSPGYPDFLESQIQCSWIIEAPIGMRVKLAFRDLDMVGTTGSCAKQFVQIIDIGTGKSQGRFCGTVRPGDYVSLGTKARIDLQADKAVTKSRGFLLSFAAVKEIAGFRSSRLFPSIGRGSEGGAPGKVNVKSFLSNSKQPTPKPSSTKRRGGKRLIYESDRNARATDISVTATESGAADPVGSEDDFGWIGEREDSQIQNSGRSRNNGNRRTNSPIKVIPNQRRPPPPGQRPTAGSKNGPMIFTLSTLPVRIRASPPTIKKNAKPKIVDGEPMIYGKHNQPYDPSDYTTLHPVRLEPGGLIDHRENKLSTTNVIIIIACGVLFFMIIMGGGTFLWFLRKRTNRRKRKKKEVKKRRKEEDDEKRERMELNVARLFDDSNSVGLGKQDQPTFLPGQPTVTRGSIVQYPERMTLHGHSSRTRSRSRNGSLHRPNVDDRDSRTVSKHGVSFQTDGRQNDMHNTYSMNMVNTVSRSGLKLSKHDSNRVNSNTKRESAYNRQSVANEHRNSKHLVRFHSLDPHCDSINPTLKDSREIERSHLKHSTMPTSRLNRQYCVDIAAEDIDEDYCSGSECGTGKAPMRREYSPWELEQHKKDRKKKLMGL